VIELAEEPAEFRLCRLICGNAQRREAIENPELLFPQPLVDDDAGGARAVPPASQISFAVCRDRT
jgi:hypothetical protein